MARRIGIATISDVLTGTAAKTMIQLVAAANHSVALTELKCSFAGVNNTHEPIEVRLVRQTTAGTMTALTLVKADDSGGDTLDTTAQHTATAEPTGGDVVWCLRVHPQNYVIWQAPPGQEIIIGAGDRLGLVVTAANDVKCSASLTFEE